MQTPPKNIAIPIVFDAIRSDCKTAIKSFFLSLFCPCLTFDKPGKTSGQIHAFTPPIGKTKSQHRGDFAVTDRGFLLMLTAALKSSPKSGRILVDQTVILRL
jgi:hypothetical protein